MPVIKEKREIYLSEETLLSVKFRLEFYIFFLLYSFNRCFTYSYKHCNTFVFPFPEQLLENDYLSQYKKRKLNIFIN